MTQFAQIIVDELIDTLNSKIKVLEELNNLKDARILQLEECLSSTEEMLKRALTLINQYQAIVGYRFGCSIELIREGKTIKESAEPIKGMDI